MSLLVVCSGEEITLNNLLSINGTKYQEKCFEKQWLNSFVQNYCRENQSKMVKTLLENISKTRGFLITSKQYSLTTKTHRQEHIFCLTKFSGENRLEAISCDYPYYIEELRVIEDEIILALLPDSLETFFSILSTNGVNHLKIKVIGLSMTTLSNLQQTFPLMLINFFDEGKRFTFQMIEEVSRSVQQLTERYILV